MESKQLELSTGARVFVATKGHGDELVVFLHAIGGDHTSWYHQMEALDDDRYTIAAYDLRGHGRSKFEVESTMVRDAVSIGGFAKDTLSLIETLGFRRAHLVGLSMGGVVALEIFKRRSDVVQSLTLANTAANFADAESSASWMQTRLDTMTMAENAKELVPKMFGPGASPELIDRAVQIEGSKSHHVYLASWGSMLQQDYRRMLEMIDVPLLLIGGSADTFTPTDPGLTSMQAVIPTAELVDIAGAGHYSHLDRPAEFTQSLRAHLLRSRSNNSQRLGVLDSRPLKIDVKTTASALATLLQLRGVEHVFANVVSSPLPNVITTPHETTAIAMAHGHWLLSGRPQAALVHANVGVANAAAGIINAARAHVPMLLMAIVPPSHDEENGRTSVVDWGQQSFDVAAPIREHLKWDTTLRRCADLEWTIDRALAIAQSDPAGPVFIALPRDVLTEAIPQFTFHEVPRQQPQEASEPSADAFDRAARIISAAQRPIIIAGELGRYRGGAEALVQLAQRHAIPVIEHGRRSFFNFPTRHPMHLGFNPSPFVKQADVIIAIESVVPWLPAFANVGHRPKVIQVGVDPLQSRLPASSFPSDVTLAGNPTLTIRGLTSCLDKSKPDRDKIAGRFAAYASEHRRVMQAAQTRAIADAAKPAITKQFLSYCIGEAIDDRVVVFNEHGADPQLVARRVPDSWFESSVANAVGWSLGAALGAQLASPDLTMLVTCGEGSYMLNTPLSAHHVAAKLKLPIVTILFNDDSAAELEKVVEACGGTGFAVTSPRELPAAIKRAITIAREQRVQVLLNARCERA